MDSNLVDVGWQFSDKRTARRCSDSSEGSTCYVIVTARTLLWTLLTIACTLSMMAAIFSPNWLVGSPKKAGLRNAAQQASETSNLDLTDPQVYVPTVGIFNRCTKVHDIGHVFVDSCATYVTSFSMPSDEFPNFWKAATVFLFLGLFLMVLTTITSVIGCCVRSIRKKSIFTVSGTVQACAGLFYILGLFMYPCGWGSQRVTNLCGNKSGAFVIGDCSLGWASYLAVGSTIVTFICSVLSVQAEVSTSSDKVQDDILEGKNLICLL